MKLEEELLDSISKVGYDFYEDDFKDILEALKYENNEITLLQEFYSIIMKKTSSDSLISKIC